MNDLELQNTKLQKFKQEFKVTKIYTNSLLGLMIAMVVLVWLAIILDIVGRSILSQDLLNSNTNALLSANYGSYLVGSTALFILAALFIIIPSIIVTIFLNIKFFTEYLKYIPENSKSKMIALLICIDVFMIFYGGLGIIDLVLVIIFKIWLTKQSSSIETQLTKESINQ